MIKGKDNSLFSAKQKTYNVACRQYSINKKIEMENFNKAALVKFFKREMGKDCNESIQNESLEDQNNMSSDTLNKSFESATSYDCVNKSDVKTDRIPKVLHKKETERFKYNGLSKCIFRHDLHQVKKR